MILKVDNDLKYENPGLFIDKNRANMLSGR